MKLQNIHIKMRRCIVKINTTQDFNAFLNLIKPRNSKILNLEKVGCFYFAKIINKNRKVYIVSISSSKEELHFYRSHLQKNYKLLPVSTEENCKIWDSFLDNLDIDNLDIDNGTSKIMEIGGIYLLLLLFGRNNPHLISSLASFKSNNFFVPKNIELEIMKAKLNDAQELIKNKNNINNNLYIRKH